jgi:hypothetical protein
MRPLGNKVSLTDNLPISLFNASVEEAIYSKTYPNAPFVESNEESAHHEEDARADEEEGVCVILQLRKQGLTLDDGRIRRNITFWDFSVFSINVNIFFTYTSIITFCFVCVATRWRINLQPGHIYSFTQAVKKL